MNPSFKEKISAVFEQMKTVFRTKPWLWGVVLGVIALTASLTYWVVSGKTQLPFQPPALQDAQLPADLEDVKFLNILLLGYGGAGHQGGMLSDVIQVARIDFENGKITLISIPRDSWVSLPGGTQNKINSAFSIDQQSGDKKSTVAKQMAQVVTGFPINYYIATDFVGFERIIGEELGGIDVEVAETMVDNWYPVRGRELDTCGMSSAKIAEIHAQYSGFDLEKQYTCRYDVIRFPAGTNHMQGGDALAYVRSRHGVPGGDFARGIRQQEVLEGIRQKLFTLEGVTDIPKVFEQFVRHTQTDLDASLVEFLWPLLKGSRSYEIVRINLSTDNVLTGGTSAGGASIVEPRESWEAVRAYIQSQM